MKKTYTLLFASVCLSMFSQTSIQVLNTSGTQTYPANSILNLQSLANDNVKFTFDVKNTSSVNQKYLVKRYDMTLNSVSGTTASAYFCFAGNCYGASTIQSLDTLKLSPGTKASGLGGSYQMLTTDLDEALTLGFSLIKYTFFNADKISFPNDTLQISLQYNGVVTQSFSTNFNFGQVTTSSGTVDPSTYTSIKGTSFSKFSAVGLSSNSTKPNSFSFSGWSTGAQDGVDTYSSMTGNINTSSYYNISIIPELGHYTTLYSIEFDLNRSNDGPRNFSVRSSIGSFASNLASSIVGNTNLSSDNSNSIFWNTDAVTGSQSGSRIALNVPAYMNFNSQIDFRFYGWNAEASSGTFELDNVVFKGISSIEITGIGTVSKNMNSKLKLYPNPSNTGYVNLEAPYVFSQIEVLNILGSSVQKETNSSNNNTFKLDLNHLPSGTYFIRISTENNVLTEKIILSR